MADIRAIETVYKGFRFRSRLEARWAVFFDKAEIEYEYEMEGFELGGGLRYLPDFWLPKFGLFVEVKPSRELSRDDLRKLVSFAADADKELLLIVGSPTTEGMYLLNRTCLGPWSDFAEEEQSEEILRDIFWEGVRDWAHVEFGHLPLQRGLTLIYKTKPPQSDYLTTTALLAAKQARFEHGRSGN